MSGMSTRTDLKIPYGVSDFKTIRNEGLYYVDKTMFPALAAGTRLHCILCQFKGTELIRLAHLADPSGIQ